MANSPTIVLGSLNDKELTAAIDKLVQHVDTQSKKMADTFDSQINRMKASLNGLGNVNINLGGTTNKGGTERVKKQLDETTQAAKTASAAIDQVAQSMEKTSAPKSARESYYAFVQGYKEQAKAMGELIKTEESRLSGTPLAKFSQETKNQLSQLDVSIDQTKWKINALYQEEKRLQQEALRQKVGSADFERAWLKKDDYKTARVREGERLIELEKERQRIIASDPSVQTLDRNIEQTRAKIQQLIADEKRLQSESLKQTIGSAEFEKLWTQKYTVRDERIKEQERLVQLERERQNLVSVDPIRTQLAKLNGMRAEHERLLNIMKDENVTSLQQVSAERKVTEELNKQMQKIFEIDSRKKASAAFQSISGMDSSTLDRAEIKLKTLEALKERVRNTDLFSAKNMQNLDAMISYQRSVVEKYKNASTSATKDDEEAIKKAAAAEEQWAEKIKARGLVAQETSRKMLRMLNEEAQAGGKGLMGMYTIDGKETNAIKELSMAIKDMQNAYNKMSDSEKESAVGRALKRDIENAKEAIRYVSAYNALASGLNRGGVGNQQQQLNMERLRQIIKQLTEDFNKLSIEDIKAGRGNLLIDRIQRTSRALQQLQAQMNRPTSLDKALKLPANTLDEITHKMQMLSNYRANLNIFDPKQKEEIDAVNKALEKLRIEQTKIMGQNKEMLASNNALVRSFNYMKNRLAFYFTIGASTQFIKQLIDIRSQYEMNERALGILINSAERGSQIFSELSQMALISPYTLIELSAAAKQLVAYDIAAKDVVDTTRRLADMASAVGVPMERLTYALGQIKAYGYLNSRDARMFANAGIPLVKQLSDYYTQLEGKIISTADVYDRMKKKAIDYNDVMAVVTKMTDEGGKFFDFQAKMAETLKVRLANLTLAWNNMLNEIGESSQGLLTSTIGGLKELFLHWKDIDTVIKNLLVAFGIWKTVQAIGLAMIGELNTAMGAQVLLGQKLGKTLTSAAASTKSFITGYGLAATALIYTLADLWMTSLRNAEELEKLNKTIADGASEASEALDKMLHSSEMVDVRLNAINNKLSSSDATKAWERIREQLELSALTSKDLIAQLMLEPDLNKRVAESFTLAEKIQEATRKLSGLNDALQYTQDSALNGAFGEGIVSDIEDYNAHLKREAELAEWASKENRGFWENAVAGLTGLFDSIKEDMGSSEAEAKNEITKFAQDAANIIRDELGEEGLKDKIQVNEAIARVIRGFEQQFPQIRGKGKALFETMFNDIMAEEFGKSFDKQAYYYNKFLDQLKKDHASAFGDVTDDILKDTHKWTSAQKDAIEKTAEKVKKDLPEASQSAIDEILRQLNSTEFKVRIVAEMATTSLDKVQQQFKDKYINKPWVADEKEREKQEAAAQQKYGTLMRKNTETNVEYEKRISDERKKQLELSQKNADIIEKNKNKQDAYSKAVLEDAKIQKQTADDWLATAEEIEKAGGYDFRTKQETKKTKGNKKDLVLEALKQEIQLVEKLQGDYDKLAKSGASQSEALATIRGAYGNTIKKLNAELGGYGLPTIDITRLIVGKDPNKSLEHFKNTLSSLIDKGMLTLERSKEVEAVIEKLTLSAKTYNLDMITKGLNNELGKLKEEYELAVELDANPELGGMFADMFGINVNELPRTFGEALDRAQAIVNRKLAEMNISTPFDLMHNNIQQFTKMSGLDSNSDIIKELTSAQKVWQDMFKKNITETEKMLDDYIKKYGDYSDKIAEIEADRLEKIKKLNEAYYTEEMRKLPEYTAKMNAINEGAMKEEQKVDFDDFKDSRYYTMMFENLDYISTKTLRDMRDRLREYIDTAKDLTPEQLKTIISQYEKIEQKIVKRSPFKTLAKDMKEYFNTSKERKAANNAFKNAQKEYDAQKKVVSQLKKKYEQAKANTKTSQSYLDFLKIEIDGENEVLKILQEQLDAAQKKADKYNLAKKLALEEAEQTAQLIAQNAQSLAELRDNLNELFGIDVSKGETLLGHNLDGMIDGFAKAGQGISGIVSSAENGDIFGIVNGVVNIFAGIGDGIASLFGDGSARTKRINREINESVEVVRKLNMAYKELEYTVEKEMGAEELRARRTEIANKKLQLAELERQKKLEESKRSKDRDDDKIKEYEEAIQDLKIELKELADSIADTLLGTSVKEAAESFVDTWVSAWRAGEDTMAALDGKFDDMIDNMIMKSIASRVVANRLQQIWDAVDRVTNEKSEGGASVTMNELQRIKNLIGDKSIREAIDEDLRNLYGVLGIAYGSGADKSLSALQAGISGITENQASALEAYWNINTQEQFKHSGLLTEIRDITNNLGIDAEMQAASMAQILLQLQANYQAMMAMRNMMENWTVAAGNGIRVELIN